MLEYICDNLGIDKLELSVYNSRHFKFKQVDWNGRKVDLNLNPT
jgi:hypothetical protein